LSALGVVRFLYTPVEADGLLEGPRTEALAEICQAAGSGVIYSGGVSSIEDLETLATERSEELEGVIVGRALLEGRFTVGEALAALGGRPRS
jgi:phosphoribosylformimino-5-aminoimidazole carboxamide ribonucleotide (ProFAR) isomerase